MELGMIGLGKMGGKMTERLSLGGHQVHVYDLDPELSRVAAELEGVVAHHSLE
jgi:3-hydroxyisobutyrate dehydrogenase-like beta-hydroxyacid dehydrogenase